MSATQSENGYIKLYRKLLENLVFQNDRLLKVFIWCLLKASYKEHEQLLGLQTVQLKPGQFIYGRFKAAQELNIKPSTINDQMNTLKRLQIIDIKPNNKYSIISIANWVLYQSNEESPDNKSNNKATAIRQQSDTNNKGKKEKNIYLNEFGEHLYHQQQINAIEKDIYPLSKILDLFNNICVSLPKVLKLTEGRKRKLTARWKEMPDIDRWEYLFIEIEQTPFLKGQNDRCWKANFDWLIENDHNITKVLEGQYKSGTGKLEEKQVWGWSQ